MHMLFLPVDSQTAEASEGLQVGLPQAAIHFQVMVTEKQSIFIFLLVKLTLD